MVTRSNYFRLEYPSAASIHTFNTRRIMSEKKELKIRKRTTTIQEDTRRAMDITRDEYAFCGYVQYRQAYPEQKKRGFCCDGKDELAYFVGISRPGLYKMIDRLSKENLLEVEASTGFLSVTKKWIDADSGCKQSRQPQKNGVNLVDTDCKLSLQSGVNLVTGNIEVQLEDKLEQEEIMSAKTADGLPEKSSLDANPSERENTPIPKPPAKTGDPADKREEWKVKKAALLERYTNLTPQQQAADNGQRILEQGRKLKALIETEDKIDRLLNRLSEKAGLPRGLKLESADNRKPVRKRLQTDTEADCILVIDGQCRKWKDTEFRANLNPATLMNGHFEKYLNAALLDKQSPLTPKDGQVLRLEPAPERQPVRDYVE